MNTNHTRERESQGNATVTTTETEIETANKTKVLILKLREKQQKVSWTENTVDNENMGRKSSKSKMINGYDCIVMIIN